MLPIGPPAWKREKYEIAAAQFERQLKAQWSARKTTFNRSGIERTCTKTFITEGAGSFKIK